MASTHASLDAASIERKARLAKLKSLKRKAPSSPSAEEDTHDAQLTLPSDHDVPSTTALTAPFSKPPDPPAAPSEEADPSSTEITTKYLSLRTYDPTTRGPKLGFENQPNTTQETLEDRAHEIASQTQAAADAEEADPAKAAAIDLFKLQPKKPNWDLKRDLTRKMEILGARTDRAIAMLVRERVEGQRRKGLEAEKIGGSVGGEIVGNGNGAASSEDGDGGGVRLDGDGEAGAEEVGMRGEELLEGVHVREREAEERDQVDDAYEDL
ncbi:hypothetical protein MMC25_006940 [Agyrium rufum]|nr:hypothetical protein [Agyrium rufum]